eukprot:COSAG05_NODE_2600_length_2856_cov_23.183418_1_plen_247_part_00
MLNRRLVQHEQSIQGLADDQVQLAKEAIATVEAVGALERSYELSLAAQQKATFRMDTVTAAQEELDKAIKTSTARGAKAVAKATEALQLRLDELDSAATRKATYMQDECEAMASTLSAMQQEHAGAMSKTNENMDHAAQLNQSTRRLLAKSSEDSQLLDLNLRARCDDMEARLRFAIDPDQFLESLRPWKHLSLAGGMNKSTQDATDIARALEMLQQRIDQLEQQGAELQQALSAGASTGAFPNNR